MQQKKGPPSTQRVLLGGLDSGQMQVYGADPYYYLKPVPTRHTLTPLTSLPPPSCCSNFKAARTPLQHPQLTTAKASCTGAPAWWHPLETAVRSRQAHTTPVLPMPPPLLRPWMAVMAALVSDGTGARAARPSGAGGQLGMEVPLQGRFGLKALCTARTRTPHSRLRGTLAGAL
jgi:hypothetical protein